MAETDRNEQESKLLQINHKKSCSCPDNHINCMTAKEWMT
ncbi:unnamed protein product, partial [marine sediment metagenome]